METQVQEYDNRKFMIFNMSELNEIDFTQVLETSADTVRKSVDQTKTFVKWTDQIPDCVLNLLTKEGPYSYDEMLEIMNTDEWKSTIVIE